MRTSFRVLLVFFLLNAGISTADVPAKFNPPKGYVLVLGDSLAFGYQRAKFQITQNPAAFTTGFADNFVNRVRNTAPGRNTKLFNLGCPSESTTSFLAGPCAFHMLGGFSLHENYSGSQMEAAGTFLSEHHGQVGTILIVLGANDVFAVSNACGGLINNPCFRAALPQLLTNLAFNYNEILSRLRQAAPNAEIIAVGLFNPFAAADPTGFTSLLATSINGIIGEIAAANRARLADPLNAFNVVPPQPQTLCTLTFFCANADIHPTDLGYHVMADVIWESSGYEVFEH